MRHVLLMAILAVICLSAGPVDSGPSVVVYRDGEKTLTAETKGKLADWGMEFLKTANFNTANQPDILKQDVCEIQKHYRETVSGDCLIVSYDHVVAVKTVGDNVSVREIVIGLNRSDAIPSALFTVDSEGRIVAHEKYSGVLPEELRPVAATQRAR